MKIQIRTKKGSKVRNVNTVPGVLYGKGMKATSITADTMEFSKTFRKMGSSKTFEVSLEGEKHLVYIKEVQPLPSNINQARHFDLVKVSKDDTMTSKVRIYFANRDAIGKKGLILNTVINNLEIEYAVGKGISQLELDVENLEEHDTLRVSDIAIPEGVKVLNNLEDVVVTVSRPKEEVIEEEVVEGEVTEIEEEVESEE
jgi:large subunit ribosomal protein L25